ncbi:unnamed protein product [Clonostachys rhizophaga]|uniref:NACHT domain-containing protein n=1 Tax=Clonostachys rhizophaga TaxID=160324 RepID=A0A9N9VKB2_9HYPO|nr:unnamed protein product [Clonostachys rhizophaga]
MATGFEALGAASAILQVIQVAASLISNCKKVYDGKPTIDNDLELYAGRMSDATSSIQTRCKAMAEARPSKYNERLDTLARECLSVANELKAEVRSVTTMQKKGSLFRAVNAVLKASTQRKKIEGLESTLSRCRAVMETEMMSHLCSQADAIELQQKEEFKELADDVQLLVAQISRGHTKVEELVKKENDWTREVVVQESGKTQKAVTEHITKEVGALSIDAELKAQRETLLKSLKFPEMNQRYNDLMSSKRANFRRLFASYTAVTSRKDDSKDIQLSDDSSFEDEARRKDEIDDAWGDFVKWLCSDNSLFCIRGKPGSGKSTLVKFIVDNENTKELLRQWNPEAAIISHFFWKIGSNPQNSIKGFLCSLVFRSLDESPETVEQILDQLPALSSKVSYHDWSDDELKSVFYFILKNDSRQLCIFVDGLDEISNTDGLYALIKLIEEISKFPNVKMCVSSRPETLVTNWLTKQNVPGILLEDLTRPEMRGFVQGELKPFVPDNISEDTHSRLVHDLVFKAQGVFLWLHLATRSIVTGIQNGDSRDLLLARLKELPGELKDLYADMWQRLNENSPVYRETAARFFNYALDQKGVVPMFPEVGFPSGFPEIWQATLFQIACAESSETQDFLLREGKTLNASEVIALCNKTTAAIHTRCAGLLRVTPVSMNETIQHVGDATGVDVPQASKEIEKALFGGVNFIHRTAHDFLTDTEIGQGILLYGALSQREMEFRLVKGLLCLFHFLNSEFGLMGRSGTLINRAILLAKDQDQKGMDEAADLLRLIKTQYDKGAIGTDRPSWQRQPPFLSHLTDFNHMDDFVISSLKKADSRELATAVLREAWDPDQSLYYSRNRMPTVKLVQALLSMGADPHAYDVNLDQGMGRMEPFAREGSAFTNLLLSGNRSIDDGDHLGGEAARYLLMAAVSMAFTCPDLNGTTLVIGRFKENGQTSILNGTWLPQLGGFIRPTSPGIIYEVDFKFLLLHLLSGLAVDIDEASRGTSRVDELLPRLENPSAVIRFIVTIDKESKEKIAHKIAPQLSSTAEANDLIERQFAPGTGVHSKRKQAPEGAHAAYEYLMSLTKNASTERVGFEAAIRELAGRGLGFCTLLKAGSIPTPSFIEHLEEHFAEFPLTIEELKAAASSCESQSKE